MLKKSLKTLVIILIVGFIATGCIGQAIVDTYEMGKKIPLEREIRLETSEPVSMTEALSPSTFGSGKVLVRLYTDYSCSPCKKMELSLEPVITDLVKRNVITLTFVDILSHKNFSLYTRYFLYGLNGKENSERNLEYALSVRKALNEASNQKIDEPDKLEAFLNTKGVKINPFDTKQVFSLFQKFLNDDQIKTVPSCVIEKEGKKEIFVGGKDIIQAFQQIR